MTIAWRGENIELTLSKYYRPDPDLARKYLQENKAMFIQQKNTGNVPKEDTSPCATSLYTISVPMMFE